MAGPVALVLSQLQLPGATPIFLLGVFSGMLHCLSWLFPSYLSLIPFFLLIIGDQQSNLALGFVPEHSCLAFQQCVDSPSNSHNPQTVPSKRVVISFTQPPSILAHTLLMLKLQCPKAICSCFCESSQSMHWRNPVSIL